MMKKKIIGMMILAIAMMGISINTYAKEVYYTTPNGIELTEAEYNFLVNFYWEEYVDDMTQEQYEEFANSDLLSRKLIVNNNDQMGPSRSTSHSTYAKNIKISAACSSNCLVSIVATWYVNPAIRSYDVIGAFFSGVSLISHQSTVVHASTGSNSFTNLKTAYNGIGNSVLLPSGTNLVINQILTTTTGGTIYGSYQHSTQSTTLAVSKLYNFSLGGYGNVFLFYGNAYGVYDGMAGVDINV